MDLAQIKTNKAEYIVLKFWNKVKGITKQNTQYDIQHKTSIFVAMSSYYNVIRMR